MLQQNPLITREDILKYKQISKTVIDDILRPHILSAQITDLSPLLGERLFNDIVSNPEDHEDLLNGGEYSYNGDSFICYGLKAVLVHYAYARYMFFGSSVDTPFGFVNKLNSDKSTPVPETNKKTIYIESKQEALQYWLNVEKYLRRTDYDYFDTGCIDEERSNGFGFSLSKIT